MTPTTFVHGIYILHSTYTAEYRNTYMLSVRLKSFPYGKFWMKLSLHTLNYRNPFLIEFYTLLIFRLISIFIFVSQNWFSWTFELSSTYIQTICLIHCSVNLFSKLFLTAWPKLYLFSHIYITWKLYINFPTLNTQKQRVKCKRKSILFSYLNL